MEETDLAARIKDIHMEETDLAARIKDIQGALDGYADYLGRLATRVEALEGRQAANDLTPAGEEYVRKLAEEALRGTGYRIYTLKFITDSLTGAPSVSATICRRFQDPKPVNALDARRIVRDAVEGVCPDRWCYVREKA